MKKLTLIIIALLFTLTYVRAQKKWIEKLTSNEPDTTRSPSFMPLPAIGYAQETGLEYGATAVYSFYTDRLDTLTRNSSINVVATLTTKSQSNFKVESDIWSPQNKYHFTSELRYRNFPFNFYGIGDGTAFINEDKLNQKLFRLKGEVEKLLMKYYYGGLNFRFDHYSFSDKEIGGIYTTDNSLNGKEGGRVLFLGFSQIFDNRNTNTFTTKGSFLKLSYSYAPELFSGTDFSGSLFNADFRTFKALTPKTVLAFQLVYNTIQGKNTPFYLLQQLGNDEEMRGYYTGRYRDENLISAQTEFRYRFISRLGVAAFAGAGNVFQNRKLDLDKFKPTYGAGLRYFFEPERGMSIRLDYGIGEKRPGEERQKGFYISFGESF